MALVTFGGALLCDAASVREGLLHILGGGVSVIGRPNYPAPLGAEIAVQLLTEGEAGETFAINVGARARSRESGELAFEIEGSMDGTSGIGGPGTLGIVLPLRNAGLPVPGIYDIEVLLNGEVKQTLSVQAKEAKLDSDAPGRSDIFA